MAFIELILKVLFCFLTSWIDLKTRKIQTTFLLLQFVLDSEESAFQFQTVSGVVKADARVTVIIKFIPAYPINYYRRVTCLVHNQVSFTMQYDNVI